MKATLLARKVTETFTPKQVLALIFEKDDTQKHIGSVLGVPQSTVSNWVHGRCDMSQAVRRHVLRILGVAPLGDDWIELDP